GSARLEGASAKDAGSGLFHVAGDGGDLLAAFDGAGAAHQDDLRTAHCNVPHLDGGAITAKFPGHEFIGLEDGSDRLDAGNGGERFFTNHVFRSNDTDDDADGAAAQLGTQTPLMDAIDDMLNLVV